ncbi:MAG: NifB/NifX family molybdenum-iron cluster-binding protein [bacterium]
MRKQVSVSFHDVDRHGPILNALRDCTAVISRGMGRRIYADLKNTGIDVCATEETDISKAIELYVKGALIDKPERSCSQHKNCREE